MSIFKNIMKNIKKKKEGKNINSKEDNKTINPEENNKIIIENEERKEEYNKKEFLPEARYSVTKLTEKPEDCIGKIVHVFPIKYFPSEDVLSVEGANFIGNISKEELSIYQMEYFEGNKIPKFLYKVFRMQQCLTAKIIGYDETKHAYILSRKKTMEEALEANIFPIGSKIEAKKIGTYKKMTFVDIGAGISAIIPSKEHSISFTTDAAEFFKELDFIPVKIIEKKDNRFVCSYKDYFEPKKIFPGYVVNGKIANYTPDRTGVFVEISPTQVGIVDLGNLKLIEEYEYDENEKDSIVRGRTYNFVVIKVRPPKEGSSRNHMHYCLQLLDI